MPADYTYAVLELSGAERAAALFKILLDNGFGDHLTFLNNLQEHPTVRTFTEERDRTIVCKGECQPSNGNVMAVEESNHQKTTNGRPHNSDMTVFHCDGAYNEEKPEATFHAVGSGVSVMLYKSPESTIVERSSIDADCVDGRSVKMLKDDTELEPSYRRPINNKKSLTTERSNRYPLDRVASNTIRSRSVIKKITSQRPKITNLSCKLCDAKIPPTRFSYAVDHAKRHCPTRFHCASSDCDFSRHEKRAVVDHMFVNHNIKDEQPNDRLTSWLKKEWFTSFGNCFPSLKEVDFDFEHIHTSSNNLIFEKSLHALVFRL